jgi:hypothetical protein
VVANVKRVNASAVRVANMDQPIYQTLDAGSLSRNACSHQRSLRSWRRACGLLLFPFAHIWVSCSTRSSPCTAWLKYQRPFRRLCILDGSFTPLSFSIGQDLFRHRSRGISPSLPFPPLLHKIMPGQSRPSCFGSSFRLERQGRRGLPIHAAVILTQNAHLHGRNTRHKAYKLHGKSSSNPDDQRPTYLQLNSDYLDWYSRPDYDAEDIQTQNMVACSLPSPSSTNMPMQFGKCGAMQHIPPSCGGLVIFSDATKLP